MNRRREVGAWDGGVCVCEYIGASSILRFDTQGCGLGENVTDLRFELVVKCSAAEAELVLVVLCTLNS